MTRHDTTTRAAWLASVAYISRDGQAMLIQADTKVALILKDSQKTMATGHSRVLYEVRHATLGLVLKGDDLGCPAHHKVASLRMAAAALDLISHSLTHDHNDQAVDGPEWLNIDAWSMLASELDQASEWSVES